MRQPCRILLLAAAVCLAGCERTELAPPPGAAYAPQPVPQGDLHSLWEGTQVALTDRPYACGPARFISPDISVATTNSQRVPLSPATRQAVYAESDAALRDLTARSVAAANHFRSTGSRAAAGCVFALLATAARTHGMAGYMSSDAAFQEQNRALRSISIAYLKVRDTGIGRAYDEGLIDAWLDDIARQERDHILAESCGKTFCGQRGHLGLAVASAAAAAAVASNDRELYDWAIVQYKTAVKSIDERGMLPDDTRGPNALRFNLIAAAALVQIAEFGEANNEGMYAFDNGGIHLLIHAVSRGLIDPAPFASATGMQQTMSRRIEPWQVSWAAVYDRRFPDPVLNGLLAQVGARNADMWSGEPWGMTE
ncbi:poly(beta-D-mannuronate) lyase [Granulicella rosea]|uniref:Poly(Beta-D-mannuronate) lyase n=1 Tax=Granulicella rosea TaxID=474952 RepID=A0A239IDQ7_9BACT|nr:alginate lyase family protein [Granulicella rosea]SNS91701.1 poly(beta-D-mannuronate) lyase [Granulicella rosea]